MVTQQWMDMQSITKALYISYRLISGLIWM